MLRDTTLFPLDKRKRPLVQSVSFHDRAYSSIEASSLLTEIQGSGEFPRECQLLEDTIDFLNVASICPDTTSAQHAIEKILRTLQQAHNERATLLPGAFSYCARYIKQQMNMCCQLQLPFAQFYHEHDRLLEFLSGDWDDADKTPVPSPVKPSKR